MQIDLGRVVPIYRGYYDAGAAYELNDIVLYTDGNLYWHVSATPTVGVAPTDATVWSIAFFGADLRQAMAENVSAAETARTEAQKAEQNANSAQKGAETAAGNAGSSASAAARSEAAAKEAAAKAAADKESAETAAVAATEAAQEAQSLAASVVELEKRLKSGLIEDAALHLGFYLDADGDLCQMED